MDAKQLEVRIDKKKADIAKIEKRIDKWEKAKSEATFVKDEAPWYSPDPKSVKTMADLVKARADKMDNHDMEAAKSWVDNAYAEHIANCESEIRRANRELADANATLEKYENELEKVNVKAATPKLPIFVEFLNNWKEAMVEYITENVQVKEEYYKVNSERTALHNNAWKVRRGELSREEYEEQDEALSRREKALKGQIHPITDMVYSRRYEDNIDHEELEKILNKEVENKYWNMIAKTQEITGEIVDASGLRIGADGNINGVIIGEKGKARLETIMAGGYNQDIIVNTKHGQCLHYRLLVHPIK